MRVAAALVVLILAAACTDSLPDQDLRILSATPVMKLSADILWKEYAADRAAADRSYRGKAIVVTGTATSTGSDAPTDRFVLFGQTEDKLLGVRANLLDEQAVAILERAREEPRVTLKCFCQGLDGHVVLKSCVVP